MTNLKIRENRVRRMAERQLLRLEKCKRRDKNAIGFGGYQLVDYRNNVVEGCGHHEFDATLDQIEQFLTDPKRAWWKKDQVGEFVWTVPK